MLSGAELLCFCSCATLSGEDIEALRGNVKQKMCHFSV